MYANESPAPAQSIIEKVKYRFNATLFIESPYIGPPGEMTDGAWHDLLDSEVSPFLHPIRGTEDQKTSTLLFSSRNYQPILYQYLIDPATTSLDSVFSMSCTAW